MDQKLGDADPRTRLNALLDALRQTDPFGYAQVPFVGRPLHKWLEKAEEFVQRADGEEVGDWLGVLHRHSIKPAANR